MTRVFEVDAGTGGTGCPVCPPAGAWTREVVVHRGLSGFLLADLAGDRSRGFAEADLRLVAEEARLEILAVLSAIKYKVIAAGARRTQRREEEPDLGLYQTYLCADLVRDSLVRLEEWGSIETSALSALYGRRQVFESGPSRPR